MDIRLRSHHRRFLHADAAHRRPKPYHLSITDTAGQEEYRGMWQSANSSMRSDAFLFVYDITRRESLEALDWFDDLVSMEGEAAQRRMDARAGGKRAIAGEKGGSAAGLGLVAGGDGVAGVGVGEGEELRVYGDECEEYC
ncbi:hypothetical protein EYC84_009249 [Monilinia fructicola]|nr:hypothetical protein EYC84_009249 [Monilinia fructicola]